MQKPRAAFTFFHVLWLTGILCSVLTGYALARHAPLFVRVAITLGAGALGVVVSHLVIVMLVIFIVIPRLERGSGWEYEVDCYMRSIFGSDWPD